MRRYYITDRKGCADVMACIEAAVVTGVDYIQIREKDLSTCELLAFTKRVVEVARGSAARILVNGRVDVALAAQADGVHLPANSIPPPTWRAIVPRGFLIAASCHSSREVAEATDADFVVFGPVYPSPGKGAALGLPALKSAVELSSVPVFALGGLDETNAADCMEAGAAGIAAIRMFQWPKR